MNGTYPGTTPRLGKRSDRRAFHLLTPAEPATGWRAWIANARRLRERYGRRFVSSRFVAYGMVGVVGVGVSTALLYLLVSRAGFNHLVAAGISSEVSILTNFALNDIWTFRDRRAGGSWIGRAGQYNAVTLGGMLIQLSVLAVLTMGCGIHYLIANLIAIGFATISNYALNSRFTWRASEHQPSRRAHLRVVADA